MMASITDVLEELGIDYRRAGESPHVTRNYIGIVCHYCGEGSGKYGMGIHAEKGFVTCWKCNSHKPLIAVLHDITRKPYSVLKPLLEGIGSESFQNAPRTDSDRPRRLTLPEGIGTLSRPHIRYLKGIRGFDPSELERVWGVQGIGLAVRLAWRVFIPIAERGKIVSWTTRAIRDDVDAKYVDASPEQEAKPAKRVLFGEDLAGHAIIVCEGPLDAMRVGPGAVALLGSKWSSAQLEKIARHPVRVIALDNEPEAQRKARELCDLLSVRPGKTIRVEIDAKDPGSASPKEIKLLRRSFLR